MASEPLTLMFADDGMVPNNPALPALVYQGAIDLADASDPAAAIERVFKTNGWGRDMWRNGVFPFVHYHAMVHEALGIACGSARVQLGGHNGETLDFKAGDVAVLPAGTGHQKLLCSDDFLVVGGYPPDGTYNLCRDDNPAERGKALTTIPNVPVPDSDPVSGSDGPLPKLWRRAGSPR
jgi:uncharacterized protein YjlB